MLVPLEGYQEAWNLIRKESVSHSTYRLVVFVSCMDVDAFAAAMMLGSLLRKHLILYKTEPVVGYDSLKRRFERLDPSIRNVFLVGCGANVDLEVLLNLDLDNDENDQENLSGRPRPRPKIHIFDRNRPWNLNNLYGSDMIHCYDDGTADDLEPYRQAYDFLASNPRELANETKETDGVGDSEDEEEKDEEGNQEGSDHDEKDELDGLGEDNNNTQEDEEQVEDARKEPASKRRRTQTLQYTQFLNQYYEQGSHISSTCAVSVYTLLTLIGETTSRMLWLAIIGVTSVEAQHPKLYRLLLPSLKDEMRRMNQTELGTNDGSAANSRQIRFSSEADYSLFLLRQWSLYDSMIHSSYVSAKLFLWREDGRKKLHKMLARVGITLQDAKQTWIHTKPALKRELKSKLDSISGYYGIEGITRDGVVRQFGLSGTMSAGDCVESIAAILETGKNRRTPFGDSVTGDKSSSTLNSAALTSDTGGGTNGENTDDNDPQFRDDATTETWVHNFWTAWDALDSFERLHVGAEQAKVLQKSVVATANFIFDKNLPKDLHSFRMVIVQEAPDIEVFLNPLSLQRLAVWISESCAEIHTSSVPLILAVLNEHRDVYLVFGISGHLTRDQHGIIDPVIQRNQFGVHFQETALAINAKIRIDAFDSAIIEVKREDLPRFLEALDIQIRSRA